MHQKLLGWSWWLTPVINEARRLRQEDHDEFEASLGYT
jgi:hypothetical protein